MSKQITVTGKRGACVLASVDERADGSIVVGVEDSHVTERQLARALNREYPRHTFYAHRERGYWIAQADPVTV